MTGLAASTGQAEALAGAADELAACSLTLARRFAAGATLWCAAPAAAHHARHVAVEFVHPAIVGKRALPAVAVEPGADLVGALRLTVRPGDVVVLIGSAGDPAIDSALRRAEPWGVTTIHLATGSGTAAGTDTAAGVRADHTVEVGPADEGGPLLAYHLLWELTHVVFEHPGLLREDPPAACTDDVCITCSDEGRVVEVQEVLDHHTATVLAAGRREVVDTSVVPAVAPGDVLLVHAGLALTVLEGGVS